MRIVYTSQFKKDYKRALKQNKDIEKLRIVIEILVAKEELAPKFRDHPLTGKWKGFRDCHLDPDWVLIYKAIEDVLILQRTGSHAELFK